MVNDSLNIKKKNKNLNSAKGQGKYGAAWKRSIRKKGHSIDEEAPLPEDYEEPSFDPSSKDATWSRSQRKNKGRFERRKAEREEAKVSGNEYYPHHHSAKRQRSQFGGHMAADTADDADAFERGNNTGMVPSSSMAATPRGGQGWSSKGSGKGKRAPATGWNERRDWVNPNDHQFGGK